MEFGVTFYTNNLYLSHLWERSMTFCHSCGHKLSLGTGKFCPRCGIDLQQKTAAIGGRSNDNNQSIGIQGTGGDVLGTGFSGSGNVTAKDTKGISSILT